MEENGTKFVLTKALIKKMLEWSDRKETKFIKVDPVFWTEDKFYLFQTLNLASWLGVVNDAYDKQFTIILSEEKSSIVTWFLQRYSRQ